MIKITVGGKVYEFDNGRLLLAEAREMKTLTGLTPPRWSVALDEGDADAVAALIYMAKKRAGETITFSDLDGLDYADIEMELIGEAEDGDAQQEADPTPRPVPPDSGLTPSNGTGPTSPPSPTTSSTTPTASTP